MMGFSVYSILESKNSDPEEFTQNSREIILKVPVSLPYLSDWQSPEEGSGELLHEADYYDIVSKQIVNDTLYVKCQFNENARDRFWNLVSTFDEHISSSQDPQKGHNSLLLKNLLKEYMANGRKHTFIVLEWLSPVVYQNYAWSFPEIPENDLPAPPPDLV